MLAQRYVVKPGHLLALIRERTGLAIAPATLKTWRREAPLDLPTSRVEADEWLHQVLRARHERKKARRERLVRATMQSQSG
jgi:hypothetical protein